jgi:hypothetical protein
MVKMNRSDSWKTNITINLIIVFWNKRKNKDHLKQRIREIKLQIANSEGQAEALQKELEQLELKEFEEDLREENNQVLLKG